MNWLAKLEKMKKELEETVRLERRKLLMEQEMISFKLGNLEKKIGEVSSLETELETLKNDKEDIRKAEEDKIGKERFLADLKVRINKINETEKALKRKTQETDLKLKLLDDPEPHCPICFKEMRYDEKVRVKNRLLEGDKIASNLNMRNTEQLQILEEKKAKTEEEIKEMERKLMSKPLVFERADTLQKKIEDTRIEARKLRELEDRDREIRENLKSKKYAEVAQKVLKEIEKEIKESL